MRYLPDSTSRTNGQLREVCWGMMFYRVVLATLFLSIFLQPAPQQHSCESALLCLAVTTIIPDTPHLLRDSQAPPFPHYLAHAVMALWKQQTCWDSPEFTIGCRLTSVSGRFEADGCVPECLEAGLNSPPLITSEQGIL